MNEKIITYFKDFSETRFSPISFSDVQAFFEGLLSEQDMELLFDKLISNVLVNDEESKKYASKVFYYLLNREGEYNQAEIVFITEYLVYLNYYHFKYDEDGNIRNGYHEAIMPDIDIVPFISDDHLMKASFSSNTLSISSILSILPFQKGDKKSLFSYIQILCHEMIHYRQDYEAKYGLLTNSSFRGILFAAIKGQDFDDSVRNYHFRDVEVEAQAESMKTAILIVKNFMPDYSSFIKEMSENRNDYLLSEAFSFQLDDQGTLALRDFYDIGLLSVAISNNTNLLRKFPQLGLFFNDNGQMQSEEKLLDGYQTAKKTNKDVANIYEMFLVYLYQKEEILKNISLSPELLSVKRSFIRKQIEVEETYLETIEQILSKHPYLIQKIRNASHFDVNVSEIIQLRRRRIERYQAFLGEKDINNISFDELEKMTCFDDITQKNIIAFDTDIDSISKK